jgi:hypothetical protein
LGRPGWERRRLHVLMWPQTEPPPQNFCALQKISVPNLPASSPATVEGSRHENLGGNATGSLDFA